MQANRRVALWLSLVFRIPIRANRRLGPRSKLRLPPRRVSPPLGTQRGWECAGCAWRCAAAGGRRRAGRGAMPLEGAPASGAASRADPWRTESDSWGAVIDELRRERPLHRVRCVRGGGKLRRVRRTKLRTAPVERQRGARGVAATPRALPGHTRRAARLSAPVPERTRRHASPRIAAPVSRGANPHPPRPPRAAPGRAALVSCPLA